MGAKTDLLQAREEMLSILDEKLFKMPEWKAFRAMDRALAALPDDARPQPMSNGAAPTPSTRERERRRRGDNTYAGLALEAIRIAGIPLPIDDIVSFIGARRKLGDDIAKVRIAIGSGLSRDKRLQFITWFGGKGWWPHDRDMPQKESAGPSQ
jgi:hypothetical protein